MRKVYLFCSRWACFIFQDVIIAGKWIIFGPLSVIHFFFIIYHHSQQQVTSIVLEALRTGHLHSYLSHEQITTRCFYSSPIICINFSGVSVVNCRCIGKIDRTNCAFTWQSEITRSSVRVMQSNALCSRDKAFFPILRNGK